MVCRLKEQIRLATGTELLAFSTLKTWGDVRISSALKDLLGLHTQRS